ncbi:hypothetical protein FB451DRAFT_1173218 [Mycena latifolia]|nr:hypothetical protein FB451DRAFT_1173218 [Mycena latifolia]
MAAEISTVEYEAPRLPSLASRAAPGYRVQTRRFFVPSRNPQDPPLGGDPPNRRALLRVSAAWRRDIVLDSNLMACEDRGEGGRVKDIGELNKRGAVGCIRGLWTAHSCKVGLNLVKPFIVIPCAMKPNVEALNKQERKLDHREIDIGGNPEIEKSTHVSTRPSGAHKEPKFTLLGVGAPPAAVHLGNAQSLGISLILIIQATKIATKVREKNIFGDMAKLEGGSREGAGEVMGRRWSGRLRSDFKSFFTKSDGLKPMTRLESDTHLQDSTVERCLGAMELYPDTATLPRGGVLYQPESCFQMFTVFSSVPRGHIGVSSRALLRAVVFLFYSNPYRSAPLRSAFLLYQPTRALSTRLPHPPSWRPLCVIITVTAPLCRSSGAGVPLRASVTPPPLPRLDSTL